MAAAKRLAHRLHNLDHPAAVRPPHGEELWGDELRAPAAAAAFLADAVQQAHGPLVHWLGVARQQLHNLGVIVAQDQHRQVLEAIEQGEGTRAQAIMCEHSRLAQRNLRAVGQSRDLDSLPGVRLIRRRGS